MADRKRALFSYAGFFLAIALIFSFFTPDSEAKPRPQSAQLERLASFNQKAKAYVMGDIRKILSGIVSRKNLVRIELPEIIFALGSGSFSDEKETGDMMVVGGRAYVKSTNPFRNFKTESKSHLMFSPFSLGLGQTERADAIFHFKSGGLSMNELYQELLALYPRGFAVAGLGIFDVLKGSAFKAAPIQGEPITGKNAAKYIHPTDTFRNQKAAFFGVIVNPAQAPEVFSKELLERAFYENPSDASSAAFKSHTHFVTSGLAGELPRPLTAEEFSLRLKAAKLNEARHLLSQSTLKEAVLLIYSLESLVPYAP